MGKSANKRIKREGPPPVPEETRVPVVIRAGHTHRGVTYHVDTSYLATPREVERLTQFNALIGDG